MVEMHPVAARRKVSKAGLLKKKQQLYAIVLCGYFSLPYDIFFCTPWPPVGLEAGTITSCNDRARD